MRIHYDFLWSLDNNESVLLVSLDLSAAFDTIDHYILLYRLESVFGIAGTCLNWFKSYLTGRRLRVFIDGTASDIRDLKFGVPQGSVLCPELFTMYLQPLGEIARKRNVKIHIYADDCQLYISLKKSNCFLTRTQSESLLADYSSLDVGEQVKTMTRRKLS